MIKAESLRHGGVIANYICNAACRHCLYACSPTRTDGYISSETARALCSMLLKGGCRSLHIGGGEPFLDVDGLITLARCVMEAGIALEYVETNAFWSENERAMEIIDRCLQAGITTFCISLDQFHAEYIQQDRPIKLAELCKRMGMGFFLWRTQSLTYGGRAVNIEMESSSLRPAEELVSNRPCRRLTSGDHFHVDLYGHFIPPGCTGFALPLDEVIAGLTPGRYPVLEVLYKTGTKGLLRFAIDHGFKPDPVGYSSACALCFFIRYWLTENAPYPELYREHYKASLEY